jgi:hypothetical protein
MSAIRRGSCGGPGPGDLHCQDVPGHRYTCHDGDDCWAEWHFEAFDLAPHRCDDPLCSPSNPTDAKPRSAEVKDV